MGSLMHYSGIATKIRAMGSRLLDLEDFERLAGMGSIPEAVEYLSEIPSYKAVLEGKEISSVRRGDIEPLMVGTLYYDFSKLYRFSNAGQKEILKLYFRKYEIAAIKRAMRRIFSDSERAADLSVLREAFQKFTDIHVDEMIKADTVFELLFALRDTEYQKVLEKLDAREQITLFDCEMVLDLFYFSEVWKKKDKLLKGKELKHLTEIFGGRIDLLNMTWIYRAKKYYKLQDASVYALLIPVTYKLRESDIRAMVMAEGLNDLDEAIRNTCYGRKFKGLETGELEHFYYGFLQKIYSDEKRKEPYSIAAVTGYLYAKEEEIRKLTTVLEGVRYGLPKEETLSYIT